MLENQIISFARGNNFGICISTQIVEASLDIDFDVLYTYLSSIDSLIQRMGRVYRSRKNENQLTNIFVYTVKNGIGTIYDNDIFNRTLSCIRKYDGKMFIEDDKIACVDEVYKIEEISNTNYFQTYNNKLNNLKNIYPLTCDLNYAKDKFRNIHSVKLIPDVIYEQYNLEILINKINENPINKYELLLQLDNYCVNYSIFRPLKSYQWFDHISLIEGMDIYRTNVLYDFDKITLSGKGLLIDKKQDEEEQYI